MNKVMTRAQHPRASTPDTTAPRAPGTTAPRTPSATSTPAAVPPRTPGGGRPRTAPGGGRPPGPSKAAGRARTRPADTRPASGPGRSAATAKTAVNAGRTVNAAGTIAATTADADQYGPAADTGPRVPAPSPRRPLTQLRPTDVFADRLLAVLSGQRPVHYMLGLTAGRAYDELAWLAERGPLRTTRGSRPVIRDIGYESPRPGAIEAFARIGAGDRLRAMAFRLELGRDRRWRCTAVELGGPRRPSPDDD
ncbi:Rv3235 family protein [Streptomyces sp. NPDC048751]|uniref:Rv3235 family protein n=1 Tax=Streptomyces sp. NPDC048751 TaxID=3365591 RepID=UPI003713CFD5